MKDTLARKVPIPTAARRQKYYDTQELLQNEATVNFFSPQATKDATIDNYISNPFPGQNARLIYGLSFELVKQHIETDSGNSIDAEAIINAVKDAGVNITADQSYKQFLREPLSHYFNFEGTDLAIQLGFAGQAAADDSELTVAKMVTMQSTPMQRIADPFIVAANQNLNVSVSFNDASAFPTAQNWDDASQSRLYLRCKLYLAEITPEQRQKFYGS